MIATRGGFFVEDAADAEEATSVGAEDVVAGTVVDKPELSFPTVSFIVLVVPPFSFSLSLTVRLLQP